MGLRNYIWPDNVIAQGIVTALLAMFVAWLLLLVWSLIRSLYYRGQIKSCEDISGLLDRPAAEGPSPAPASFEPDGRRIFDAYRESKGLREKGPVAAHLRAIFAAGWDESQLDARALVKNTSDRFFSAHGLHRALLSVFIIVGLLGTLFGLADALSMLAEALRGGALDNEKLNQGLQSLLGSLKGAFGPSILGVLLTVVGVVLFALYLRFVAAPLGGALERATLTVWVPRLVPTTSQKLLEKLQLSHRQMDRSIIAAQRVAAFAEGVEGRTGAFGEKLARATETLGRMEQISGQLADFSEKFVEAVGGLKPFGQELRGLYQQMLQESRAFQESVRSNIAGAEEFQRQVQQQLVSQHQQLTEVLGALRAYETAYVSSRGEIDAKLGTVLQQAELAFQNLSRRNEEIARALDEALGRPLRETVTQQLSAVESTLSGGLGAVENTLLVQLAALSDRLREIDKPLNTAATSFNDTFANFHEYTKDWRDTLQREFAKQNEVSQTQLRRLDTLSDQVPELLKQISASSDSFTVGGRQLSQDIGALSQNVEALGRNVETLGQKVGGDGGGPDGRSAELLTQQLAALRELSGKLERLAARASSASSGAGVVKLPPPKPTWRERIRGWIPFVGRR
jgi:methyl-accepting chemotaxis protein